MSLKILRLYHVLELYFNIAPALFRCDMHPTLFLHVDSEALVEPAGLALVPPDHIHHAPTIVLAEIVQSPALGNMTDMTRVLET